MDFNKFETDFFYNLKKRSKKCITLINNNKDLIQTFLGIGGDTLVIDNFVKKLESIVIEMREDHKIVNKVLSHEAFSNVLTKFRKTDVLVQACKLGNKSAIKCLLHMNVDHLIQDKEGMSALMYAVKNTELYFVFEHFSSNKICLDLIDNKGENVLFHALNNSKVLKALTKTSININQLNINNESVLLYCCKNKLYNQITILLTSNIIDVNLVDNDGKTAAMYLAENGRYNELLKLKGRICNYDYVNIKMESALSIVIKKLYGNGNINPSIYEKYLHTLMVLVDLKCNFNIPIDDDDHTAVMVIIIVGDCETLKYVLRYGKDIDLAVKNRHGENGSSLYIKSNMGNKCRLIFDNPTFDFQYVDNNNDNTMLMLSTLSQPSVADRLIKNSVFSLNKVNVRGENALILAAKANNSSFVEALLKHEININHQDNLGNTALYYAVDVENNSIIQQLMFMQADKNIKNVDGKSALDLAYEIDNKSIINLLTNPVTSSSSIVSTKFSPKFTVGKISSKYNELEEYLYPWINNNYTEFKMADSYISSSKKVYQEHLNDKMKFESKGTYDNQGTSEMMAYAGLGVVELLVNIIAS